VNSCPLHPDALPFEVTMNGRLGCAPCLGSDLNLDPTPLFEPIDVDAGETRCPQCGVGVRLQQARSGAFVACEEEGVHRHPVDFAVPFGLEAREQRRQARTEMGVEVPRLG
jgi:hypothetical protein